MSDIYKKQVGGTHYQSMVIQPSEFINKNNIPFAEGNAIKYLCRHKQKNQKQDLLKAKHYIDMAIDRDYPEEVKEEKIVNTLANGLITVFVDNPWLLDYFKSKVEVEHYTHKVNNDNRS